MNPIFLTIVALSLFSEKEGKEKKELHNNAETFFAHADYQSAKKSYQDLFKKINKPEDDWQNYVDIVVRFAEIHLLLKDYKEGEELLVNLIKRNPPKEFAPRITVLFARICSFQEKAGLGYAQMQEAAKMVPVEKWRPEERSFFHAAEYALNAYYDNLLQKAKHFALAGTYKEAINAYETVLQGISSKFFPNAINNPLIEKKISFRLAESHFLSANLEKSSQITNSDECDAKMVCLAALFYKEKREYEKTILSFTNLDDSFQLLQYDSALFEMGQFYFRNGNFSKAKEYLEKLVPKKQNPTRPAIVGLLSLGKIYLKEGSLKEAEGLFSTVLKHLKNDDPLYFESHFLMGEVAFSQKQYQKASQLFEMAIIPSGLKGNWTKSALRKLAVCYVHQNDTSLVKKGEDILVQFLKREFDEEIALTLGDFYASTKNVQKFRELEAKLSSKLSEIGKKEFLLIKCDLASTFEETEALLQNLLYSSHLPGNLMKKAFYHEALNNLGKGCRTQEAREKYVCKAIDSIEKALVIDDKAASQRFILDTQLHNLSLTLCQKLDLYEPSQETLYLKALLLSQMEKLEHQMVGKKTLEEIVHKYPKEGYADHALFALGMFHYKLGNYEAFQKSLLQLIEQYPESSVIDLSCFLVSEALGTRKESKETCHFFRKLCFEKFPSSVKASDAYFKCYSVDEYLKGEKEALMHIRQFPSLFPQSKLLAMAYFLIGYHETSYPIAKKTLEKALELFNKEENEMTSFRYRTVLELALLDIRHAEDMSYALKMLLSLTSELQDMSFQNQEISLIYEKSEFALFQTYHHLKQKTLAQQVLLSIFKHYGNKGITEGFYLSKAWEAQGILALEAKDLPTALFCLDIALECGEKYLTDEELSSIICLQSHCRIAN